MGEAALSIHMKGRKHVDSCKEMGGQSTDLLSFMKRSQGAAAASADSQSDRSTLDSFVTKEQTLKAEVLWALKIVEAHYSYHSSAGSDKLFQEMFPDSKIAKEFSCGEKKSAYLVCFDLATHFKQLLVDDMKGEENYIIMFDESLNEIKNSKQMDIHVRGWNRKTNQVDSRYYSSVFMGHGKADDMTEHFHDGIQGLHLQKIFQTKSFDTVKESIKDPLIEAKISAFLSVAKEIHPFLVRYQTDRPMIPFLTTDLHEVLKGVMKRFLKKELHSDVNKILKVTQMDVNESKNHCPISEVGIGFLPERKVKALVTTKKKISDRAALEFKSDCKNFLIRIAHKLLEKSPIQYQLVRCAVCLDSRRMVLYQRDCEIKFKRILVHFVNAKRLKEEECDVILREYSDFFEVVASSPSTYREFNPHKEGVRIDTFLFNNMGSKPEYSRLWQRVVKKVLMLSHGQASVERGFSFNKQLEVTNLKERSFIAQRTVVDHLRAVGGILSVSINQRLLMSAAAARQRYIGHLEDEKRKKETEQKEIKRKSKDSKLQELRKKKARFEEDSKALQASADEYAEKA
ncbi:hypothetical protein HOLleu_00669 [Holothuria leucospilota]|uniref:HAT C-terminal dimerisation domain-containing protein n=1 Tax=Holothuria leucospilota TaxID=206669 RepID=A0A9Q1CNY7_HOLLE|nr:hypothetical protein HOLleu_00669 [Holothuria leucospilota]